MEGASSIAEDGGIYLLVVDDSHEFIEALKAASELAARSHAQIALLYTLEPMEFQQWGGIEERMRAERREKAEDAIKRASEIVKGINGQTPSFYIEEGAPQDVLVDILKNEIGIKALVLGACRASNPLISYFTGKGLAHLTVPLFIIPDTNADGES